ncbi:hypothetical protein M9435_002006 [Picochlorum sp. BPE23]|nr:hypothetical protein M9435_002006 [Picochlorum sp. BPE23]
MSDKNTICGPSGAVAPETEIGPRVEDNAVEQNVTQEQPQNSVVIKEVTDENLRAALMELLEKSDLNVTTAKMLRKELEKVFGDLSGKKSFIKEEITQYVMRQQDDGNDDTNDGDDEDKDDDGDEEDVPVARSGKRRARFGQILSYEMSEFLGMEECPRGQVVKKLWEYIKGNKLQDPKNGQRIILDDKLKVLFPGRKSLNMFAMNKLISKHVFIDDTMYEQSSVKKKPKEKKRANPPPKSTEAKKSKPDGAKKTSVFSKPVKLSPELQAWMGSETSSRPEITKKFWEYVKEHNLQDSSDRRYVNADDTLQYLTGESHFKAFTFIKLIKDHVLGYA